jgi:DnaJ-class molecular chaperone
MSPNAERKFIQQTFRRLAHKLHPNVNLGSKEVEEKFKTVNEAYQHLQ